jgi:hypothetical protein
MSALFALHPALLAFGALLVSVPILIHLFNRRQFTRVEWAALDLLRQAIRKSRRRVRLEELLILILRALAVLALALLMARLLINPQKLGVGALATARTEHLVLLDDSPSMDAVLANRGQFTVARDAIMRFAEELSVSQAGDSLTLLRTSAPATPVLNGFVISPESLDQLRASLSAVGVTSSSANFAVALEALRELLAKREPGNRRVYVISDFRAHEWAEPAAADRVNTLTRLADVADLVQEIALVDSGVEIARNLAITETRCLESVMLREVPARMQASVKNRGHLDTEAQALQLSLRSGIGGDASLGALIPGATEALVLSCTPGGVASVGMQFQLTGADQFPFDDVRYTAGTVRQAMRVLAVNGEPSHIARAGETFYLRAAIAPVGGVSSGAEVTEQLDSEFDVASLPQYDRLFLCNVYELSAEQARSIVEWVKRGGMLFVAAGDLVNPEVWNQLARETSFDLLPGLLTAIADASVEQRAESFAMRLPDHPLVEVMRGSRVPLLERVKVRRHWRLELPADSSARVIAAVGDDPVLVERAVGAGSVVFSAVPLDAEWSNWPANPSFVVVLQQAVRALVPAGFGERDMLVGERLRFALNSARFRPDAQLLAPGEDAGTILRATGDGAGQDALFFVSDPLERPGLWRLRLTTHDGLEQDEYVAVNVPAEEGRGERVVRSELLGSLGDRAVRFVDGPGFPGSQGEADTAHLNRLWIILALLFLCAEQFLACRARRRQRGRAA